VSPTQGWAVCDNGTIVATSDGGKSWQAQASPAFATPLLSVTFVNPAQGWAVGFNGTIVATKDSGKSWQAQTSGVTPGLVSVAFVSSSQGWAVGYNGTIVATGDGGKSWQARTSGVLRSLNSLAFVSPTQGLAVGDNGNIVATSDGGKTWQAQTSGIRTLLQSVAFVSPTQGWAVGDNGTIVATSDGGKTWYAQTSGVSAALQSVAFISPTQGWAVGDNGIIASTSDGGQTWHTQTSGISTPLLSVTFVNPTQGRAVGFDGNIVATSDGGKTWQAQTSGITTATVLYSVKFVSPAQGWAVGYKGAIVATSDGGKTWQAQNSGVSGWLYSVAFVSPTQGWVVGSGGTIVATSDGGRTWHAQTSGVSTNFQSVAFVSGTRGWAVGEAGTIVRTVNGGRTWIPVVYWDYPPPWFYLSLVLVAFMGWEGLRQPPPLKLSSSIADRLFSDKPLSEDDFDALNMRPIAEGLSRFFRNRKTEPPMTVAITGDWGFGKSSLMQMVAEDLRKYQVRPVWFNAWHHQTEDHLLAYLLEAVRKEAIPFFLWPAGLRFRLRLIWGRLASCWLPLLASAAIIGLCADIIFPYGIGLGTLNPTVPEWIARAASIATIVAGFFGLKGLLQPFGVSPAALLQSAAEGARIQALEAKTSFRMAFADQFHDVTYALKARRMVIFVDDLDRCHPDQVLQILEATNFLASAGDCFIVLGIAREMVLAAVGLAFKEIAEEVVARPVEANEQQGLLRKRPDGTDDSEE
jgi:photosystem II stability/assembly factor-like uncharacterized protein